MGHILIVDDEKDIRQLIADILKDEGFSTRSAGNSTECINEINSAPPDLLVLDIWLKDSNMDGIDILKIAKRDNPDVPVVLISGHGNIEIAVAAIKQGAFDFIEKPFNTDQLLVVINRAMEVSKLRRENSSYRIQQVMKSEMIGKSTAFKNLKKWEVSTTWKSAKWISVVGDHKWTLENEFVHCLKCSINDVFHLSFVSFLKNTV